MTLLENVFQQMRHLRHNQDPTEQPRENLLLCVWFRRYNTTHYAKQMISYMDFSIFVPTTQNIWLQLTLSPIIID